MKVKIEGAGRGRRLPVDEKRAKKLVGELVEIRKGNNWTIRHLAEEMNGVGFRIAPRTLENWLTGLALPRPGTLLGLEVVVNTLKAPPVILDLVRAGGE